jgi:hypothetical protein
MSMIGRYGKLNYALAGAAIGLLAAMPAALAQAASAPPSRNANIWNGTPHEPDASMVDGHERAAGIALPPSDARAQDRRLERRARKLMDEAHRATVPAPPPR